MIQQLRLTDFTCFRETVIDFCPGINVLIGANGTGKTHIMKVLSAILKANQDFQISPTQSRERFESLIAEKLVNYFKPEQLGRLVRRQVGGGSSKVLIKTKGKEISFGFSRQSKATVNLESIVPPDSVNSLYLPPREMLSLFDGFLSLYEKREISIDEPYVLLAKALDSNVLKGARLEEVKDLITPLERRTGAKVIKENGRFYLKDEKGKMEAHLVAEGLRKIATLMHLIANGELAQNSVLFWDEPESNLNPKLITVITNDFLSQLAKHGVQVFIATHDFLLTHQLSLASEYRDQNPNAPATKFFCFSKNEQGSSVFEEGETLAAIDNNPILDEFAAYHDLEQKLFNNSLIS